MKRSVKSVAADAEELVEEAGHRWVVGRCGARAGTGLMRCLPSRAWRARCLHADAPPRAAARAGRRAR